LKKIRRKKRRMMFMMGGNFKKKFQIKEIKETH
jgi:hypothetical protein